MKNVLLLCMSPLSRKPQKNKYSYELKDNQIAYTDGYMTNEAPTKAVIDRIKSLGEGQRLDRVVMICSESVQKSIVLTDSESELKNVQLLSGKKIEESSHIELYKDIINKFAQEKDSVYSEIPIEYIEVSIPDFTEDFQVSEAVVEAANLVTELNDTIHLYIDFNGGQRYVAFMILAISNLMKIRNVIIQRIMTMNFDNKVNGIVPIQNMASVFESFDLISGINEYIKYGRIRGLKYYFSRTTNTDIQQILSSMEDFVNNLQLCRTDYVMNEKNNLFQMLQAYINKMQDKKNLDSYEQLFLYVVYDILEGYRGLLDGELPEIINWCVEREFVQQALTFCSEEMPGYFWRKGIFKASRLEKIEYDSFLNKLYTRNDGYLNKLRREYKKDLPEKPSKYAYDWMIKYLSFSAVKKEYSALLGDSENEKKTLFTMGPAVEDVKKEKDVVATYSYFEMKSMIITEEQVRKASTAVSKLIWQFSQQGGRVSSRNIKKNKLREILMVYFLLKEQRNVTNHADGGKDEWPYQQLCRVLKQLAKVLIEL